MINEILHNALNCIILLTPRLKEVEQMRQYRAYHQFKQIVNLSTKRCERKRRRLMHCLCTVKCT